MSSSLVDRLQSELENHNFVGSRETALELLERFPNNSEVKLCYITSLINIGKLEEALEVIGKEKNQTYPILLQKAYVFYRKHMLNDALTLIAQVLDNKSKDNISDSPLDATYKNKFLELKGQVLYRAGDYNGSKQC